MIIFVGDLHGEFGFFDRIKSILSPTDKVTFIQVGDFGFYPTIIDAWKYLPWPVYAIGGNHEYWPMLRNYTTTTEIKDNLFFVPSGQILTIEDYQIGFLGGGSSIDKYWRKENVSWFSDENITETQINMLYNKPIDILVSHSPPSTLISKHFPAIEPRNWNLPKGWVDFNALKVTRLWESMRPETFLVSGHIHHSIIGDNYRILDIGEMWEWRK